jgi:YgiT-type zinc finger domain-containing protein
MAKTMSTLPFPRCPICGGEVIPKQVEKLLRGGNDTAVLTVTAEVCLRCGERLYPDATVRRFEEIRDKLRDRETADFEPLGTTFRAR